MTKGGHVEKRLQTPCAGLVDAEEYSIPSVLFSPGCMETAAAHAASTHRYENEHFMLLLLGWKGCSFGRLNMVAAPFFQTSIGYSAVVAAPTATTSIQTPEAPPPQRGGKGHGKGKWSPWPSFKEDEPRFDGWTSSQWAEWVQTPCGNTWCSKKRVEAETIADWMVQSWGISALRAGSGALASVDSMPGWAIALAEGTEDLGARSEGHDQSFVQTLRRHAFLFSALAFSGKAGRATAKTTGKIALITGASTGIGKATAAELARSGQYSYIFLAGHNEAKTRKALEDLKGGPAKLEYLPLELASLQSVRQAAKSFQDMDLPLHTLICNAAVMALPERQVTKDGYEFQFEVNYLSHFLLVNLLLPQLTAAGTQEDPSRTEFRQG
eukprot:s1525_g12.t1